MVFFEQMCGLGADGAAEENGSLRDDESRGTKTLLKLQINSHYRSPCTIFNLPSGAFR